MTQVDRARVLLAKTAWTERYASIGEGDDPRGNHAGIRRGIGHEAFNFKRAPNDGQYYGYFRAHGGPGGGKLNLKRIDNHSLGTELGGVTVIWVSRPPKGKLRVVGWYQNATVFDSTRSEGSPWKHPLYASASNPEGKGWYVCTAPSEDSFLLPTAQRPQWMLPKSVSTIMRRTDVLYPMVDRHSGTVAGWVHEMGGLIDRIETFDPKPLPPPPLEEGLEVATTLHGQGLAPDPRRRDFIERTAMEHATKHFRAEGYAVVDVSANHPYDLECTKAVEKLQIEVKGTSGDGSRVILSEGEFEHMAPAGWVRALYVLPQITKLESGEVIVGNARIISPFNPQDYESRPISRFVLIGDE